MDADTLLSPATSSLRFRKHAGDRSQAARRVYLESTQVRWRFLPVSCRPVSVRLFAN